MRPFPFQRMSKILVSILAVIVLALGAFYFLGNPVLTGDTVAEERSKVFVVNSSHLRFYIDGVENPEMIVREGDIVTIEFSSEEGFHDWVVDEFNASTERINAGSRSRVVFVADKKGTFEYYCSVGKHRANGMKGTFIVE